MGRAAMVEEQLRHPTDGREPIRDPRVLEAMGRVPRSRFLPEPIRSLAYEDQPLPLGGGHYIAQPYFVACVAQALEVRAGDRLLEVGAGTGYLAAVLHALGAAVWAVELEPRLAARARRALASSGARSVQVREGDGAQGWPEEAPFDGVVLSVAVRVIPPLLLDALGPGGRLVAPLGDPHGEQVLTRVQRGPDGSVARQALMAVACAPLEGPLGGA